MQTPINSESPCFLEDFHPPYFAKTSQISLFWEILPIFEDFFLYNNRKLSKISLDCNIFGAFAALLKISSKIVIFCLSVPWSFQTFDGYDMQGIDLGIVPAVPGLFSYFMPVQCKQVSVSKSLLEADGRKRTGLWWLFVRTVWVFRKYVITINLLFLLFPYEPHHDKTF